MPPTPEMIQYERFRSDGDHETAARFLREHPELLADPSWTIVSLYCHARAGEVGFVRMLLDAGVDVNLHDEVSTRPLKAAIMSGSVELIRLLLDRGAEVNWGWPGVAPHCTALTSAIMHDHTQIAKMLIDAGAALNALDSLGRTPLSWALGYGRTEIAEYLKARGAMLPQQTPGWVPPPPIDPLILAVGEAGIGTLDDPILDEGEWRLRLGWGPGDYEGHVLFTQGMSARAMTVPAGGEAYRHAELVLYLEAVRTTDPGEWREKRFGLWWLAEWMQRIARYPFENDTWLNGKWTIISNEDPPRPLSEHTQMTCWLLLGEKEPLARAELPDGKSVCFYTLMPLHTAERDLALREGIVALLRLFEQHDVPLQLDPNRLCLA